MDLFELLVIAVALSLDEFAVAIAVSMCFRGLDWWRVFRLIGTFTLFHAIMLLLGFYLGNEIIFYIDDYDHWLAFGLLLFVGLRMIMEAFEEGDTYSKRRDPTRGKTLFLIALATSIDAFAIGISFAALHASIIMPMAVILIMVFAFGILGTCIGPFIGKRTGSYAEVVGGLVLVMLGINVVLEHYNVI